MYLNVYVFIEFVLSNLYFHLFNNLFSLGVVGISLFALQRNGL